MCYTRPDWCRLCYGAPNFFKLGSEIAMRVRCLVFDRQASMLSIDGVYLNCGFYYLVVCCRDWSKRKVLVLPWLYSTSLALPSRQSDIAVIVEINQKIPPRPSSFRLPLRPSRQNPQCEDERGGHWLSIDIRVEHIGRTRPIWLPRRRGEGGSRLIGQICNWFFCCNDGCWDICVLKICTRVFSRVGNRPMQSN
jgi:hypothetical protein